MLLGAIGPVRVFAWQTRAPKSFASTLPDSPGLRLDGAAQGAQPQGVQPQGVQPGTGTLAGVVVDTSGAAVPGAQVLLTAGFSSGNRNLQSAAHGEFSIDNLAAGTYTLTVKASGFQDLQSQPIVLAAGQMLSLPNLILSVAATNSQIDVLPTEVVAEAQIHAEERQRVAGILPNFYTSFVYDAAPLTAKQKFKLNFRELIDPTRFAGAAIAAGIEQADNSYSGYGDDGAAYGKRFAANLGDGLFADALAHAVFPSLFHQDPRYFYQGSGSKKSRFVHALSYTVIARSDTGKSVPNYSSVLGDIGGGFISNLYYPHADRGIGLVFINAAIGIGGRAVDALIREFVLVHLTTHVPGQVKQPLN